MSGLPIKNISKRSDRDIQLYFDTYFTSNINFNDNEYSYYFDNVFYFILYI